MKELVFVYGTLKRGCHNHPYLTGQKFCGVAETQPLYALYDLGGYPGMVEDSFEPESIRGEVWKVSAECLARLDVLEDTAHGEYERLRLPLLGQWPAVWGYVYRRPVQPEGRMGSVWDRG